MDEITDRISPQKPTLGIPKRLSQFGFPSKVISQSCWVCVRFGESQGALVLALDSEAQNKLKVGAMELWNSIERRLGKELLHRNIKPLFEGVDPLNAQSVLPPLLQSAQRVVWIPFGLSEGDCFLGIVA